MVKRARASAVVKAASAASDTVTIALDAATEAAGNALHVNLTTAVDDVLAVTKDDETNTISIALAKTTAANNAAALVEAAVQALGTVGGVDVTGATATAAGNWDTAAVATGETGAVDFSGGVDEIAVSAGVEYEVYL